MEKVIIFVMGVIACFTTIKWYLAVKKNKELVKKLDVTSGSGTITGETGNDAQTT